MKASLFVSIFLPTLLYTNLLPTMFTVPHALAARDNAGVAAVSREAQGWKRLLDEPAKAKPRRDFRLPHTDAPASGPVAGQAPIDKSVPDAAMIKAGRARAKTIKL